jgi:uncharacterized repeat protein (TIGR03943 family)
VNVQAQGVVLLLLGGAVLRAVATDMHLRYVKESLGPFLIGAGALLVAVAVMTLYHNWRLDGDHDRPAADGPAANDDHGHDHGAHHRPRVGWLLLLPVLGLLFVAPPALGSYAAGQAGTVLSSEGYADFAALPAGDPVEIGVLDYASRAVYDRGASLGERRVRLVGFLAPGPDGTPYLARMVLACCAADGRPVKVGLSGNSPAGRPADTWVRVTGRYIDRSGADPVNGERIPFLEVEEWEQVRPPKQQYE